VLERANWMLLGPRRILANHLLQKNDISVHRADRLTKAVQDEPSISPGKTFVNVDGYYSQLSHAD
jgi:hypothetical protein